MEADATDLPDEAKQALRSLLDDVPDDEVLEFARGRAPLLAGVRALPGNVGVIRDRLRSAIIRGRQLDEPIRALLAGHSLQQSFAVVLSEAALLEAFPDFAAYFGDSRFAASLLLDERPAVRRLALEYFRHAGAAAPPPSDDERARAALNLGHTFAPFLSHLAELQRGVAGPAASVDGNLRREVERQAAELRATRDGLAREQRQAARGDKAGALAEEKLRHENTALEQELDSLKGRTRAAAEDKRRAERELAELRQEFDRRVQERVEAELAAHVRPWLEPVQLLDEVVRSLAADAGAAPDVLARAESLLKRQAVVDRHSGNRAQLQHRLAAMEAMRVNVDSVRRDALSPLPELEELVADLDREIRDARGSLSLPLAASGLGETLVRINAVITFEALLEFRQFLDSAAELRAWSAADQRLLYAKLDEQFSRLMEPHVERDRKPPAPVAPLAALRQALARDQEFLLLVDGHNVLPDFFTALYEDGRPGRKAREGLTGVLVRMFGASRAPRARLYFDGREPTRSEPSGQVVVVFSGGSGQDRADRAILNDLEFYSKKSARTPCCLVSSDKELVRQARELGAMTMRTAEFAVLFQSIPSR